jgi:signal peptidase I
MFPVWLSGVPFGWRILPIVGAIVAVVGLQGCGGASEKTKIRASVRAYVAALAEHDSAGACAVVTPAYWSATAQEINVELAAQSLATLPARVCRRGLDRLFTISAARAIARKFALRGVSVQGDRATGFLTIGASTSGSGPHNARFLRSANGVWRIDCCAGAQFDRLPTVTYQVPSASMLPTLKLGQVVTFDNAAMRAHPPALGDIVTLHPPKNYDLGCLDSSEGQSGGSSQKPCGVARTQESNQTFLKRVVGVPGDRIAMVDGHVYRNGVREKDSYIAACAGGTACEFPVPITVPRGDYYVLGDNRGESDDSRFWGPVQRSWIIGILER